jgi:hypothetical protein
VVQGASPHKALLLLPPTAAQLSLLLPPSGCAGAQGFQPVQPGPFPSTPRLPSLSTQPHDTAPAALEAPIQYGAVELMKLVYFLTSALIRLLWSAE